MKKKSYFPLFLDWAPVFESLNPVEAKMLIDALFVRFFDNKIPKIDNPKIKKLYSTFADRIIDSYRSNDI